MATTRPAKKAAGASRVKIEEPSIPAPTKSLKRGVSSKVEEQGNAKKSRGVKRRASSLSSRTESKARSSIERHPPGEIIERGYIYFFYRPKVQLEEAQSIDDVKNFHILLIPRPPALPGMGEEKDEIQGIKSEPQEGSQMRLVPPGADAVPASPPPRPAPYLVKSTSKPLDKQQGGRCQDHVAVKYRYITVGRKQLPVLRELRGRTAGRNDTFWANVASVGDDLCELGKGLAAKTYETKTRGTRVEASARLAARGAYAIVSNTPRVPSDKKTYLGWYLSHPAPRTLRSHHGNPARNPHTSSPPAESLMKSSSPSPKSELGTDDDLGEVQRALGIVNRAESYIIQVKNPFAPSRGPIQVRGKPAEYPDRLMRDVFGCSERMLDEKKREGSKATVDLAKKEDSGGPRAPEDAKELKTHKASFDGGTSQETEIKIGSDTESAEMGFRTRGRGRGRSGRTRGRDRGKATTANPMTDKATVGNTKGREDFGLRFANCETTELLDYPSAQLILIASKVGLEGLGRDIGVDRAKALEQAQNLESEELSAQQVLIELGLDPKTFHHEPLEGEWI